MKPQPLMETITKIAVEVVNKNEWKHTQRDLRIENRNDPRLEMHLFLVIWSECYDSSSLLAEEWVLLPDKPPLAESPSKYNFLIIVILLTAFKIHKTTASIPVKKKRKTLAREREFGCGPQAGWTKQNRDLWMAWWRSAQPMCVCSESRDWPARENTSCGWSVMRIPRRTNAIWLRAARPFTNTSFLTEVTDKQNVQSSVPLIMVWMCAFSRHNTASKTPDTFHDVLDGTTHRHEPGYD